MRGGESVGIFLDINVTLEKFIHFIKIEKGLIDILYLI